MFVQAGIWLVNLWAQVTFEFPGCWWIFFMCCLSVVWVAKFLPQITHLNWVPKRQIATCWFNCAAVLYATFLQLRQPKGFVFVCCIKWIVYCEQFRNLWLQTLHRYLNDFLWCSRICTLRAFWLVYLWWQFSSVHRNGFNWWTLLWCWSITECYAYSLQHPRWMQRYLLRGPWQS